MENVMTMTDIQGDPVEVSYSSNLAIYKKFYCHDSDFFPAVKAETIDKILKLFGEGLRKINLHPDPNRVAYKLDNQPLLLTIIKGTTRHILGIYYGRGDVVDDYCVKIYDLITAVEPTGDNIVIRILFPGRGGGFTSKWRDMSPPKFTVKDCYNDEAVEFFEDLKRSVKKGGISLLHGAPGTGKTTFIKFLAQAYLDDDDIQISYIPVSFLEENKSSNLIEFLDGEGSQILVLEDAEALITSRDERASFTSLLLNTTDGILGDICNLHIIVTFNCEISEIDPALTRKGRLKCMHEFKTLSVDRALLLKEKLNVNIDSSLTCDIFNSEDQGLSKKEKVKIGF